MEFNIHKRAELMKTNSKQELITSGIAKMQAGEIEKTTKKRGRIFHSERRISNDKVPSPFKVRRKEWGGIRKYVP